MPLTRPDQFDGCFSVQHLYWLALVLICQTYEALGRLLAYGIFRQWTGRVGGNWLLIFPILQTDHARSRSETIGFSHLNSTSFLPVFKFERGFIVAFRSWFFTSFCSGRHTHLPIWCTMRGGHVAGLLAAT